MCINKTTINKWLEAKAELDSAKRKELDLRKKVIADMKERHPDSEEGTKSHEFNGIRISVSFKTTKTVDEAVLDTLWDDLTEEEKDVFVYKPSVVASKYKSLKNSPSLGEIITITPAQASVTFKMLDDVE